ncbi:MAG: macro domain-containing protein [Nocardioidaceae bacterium]
MALGDITTFAGDVIVNAANSRMRGGGGVDGAIHRAAGPALLREERARYPHGLQVGQAAWTSAGDLPCRWIIHVVGPNRHQGQTDPDLLASCYREALKVADSLGATTVAFPLVSAGAYGWDVDDATRIAVGAVRITSTQVREVTMYAFSTQVETVLRAALVR